MEWIKQDKIRYTLLAIAVIAFVVSGFYEFKSEWKKYYNHTNQNGKVENEKLSLRENTEDTENVEGVNQSQEKQNISVQNLEEVQGNIPDGFYNNTLFIGDSRTVGLQEYGNISGATFFANEGMSVYKMDEYKENYEGLGQVNLEELLQNRQFERIFFMIGINELGYNQDTTITKYREWVDKIQSLQPDTQLILCGNLHVTKERSDQDTIFNNNNINALNQKMEEIASEKGLKYIDANSIFDDETGSLAISYSNDDTHPVGKYYETWAVWLANYQTYE